MAAVLEWKDLTRTDFEKLDRDRCVVTVTCSPLEVHGPHLPVITDNLEAEGLLAATCARVGDKHPEITFLHLPPIYVAADVLPHRGSIMFRSSTIIRVVEDLGRSLAKQGFRDVWIANFHGGPRHFVPLELACDRVNKRHGSRMISVFSLLITMLTGGSTDLADVLSKAGGVDREDLVGDSHGGAIETSMMLHLLGERAHLVGPYTTLPRRTVDLKLAEQGKAPRVGGARPSFTKLVTGLLSKLKYYEDETYSGKPSIATAELGEKFLAELSRLTADALSDVWTRKLHPDQARTPLWRLRHLLSNDFAGRLVERAVGYKTQVF